MPLDSCGIAPLSELSSVELRNLFCMMEAKQANFLLHERDFRTPGYFWTRDPLHFWSREWEYPFVYKQIRNWRNGLNRRPVVMDFGSGVNFFPHLISELDCHVVCTDTDPYCESDVPRASRALNSSVEFRRSSGIPIPFADGEVDAIYSVSVLEHIPDFQAIVHEFARTLKQGGILVLTIDLALVGNEGFTAATREQLLRVLSQTFQPALEFRQTPIRKSIRSDSGKYKLDPSFVELPFFYLKQLIKPLFGRKPVARRLLAVEALVFRRI